VTELVKVWDLRRARCLAVLVVGLMRSKKLGVAEIGRCLPTPTTAKHHIKAVDRFLGNAKVDLTPLWQALLTLAAGRPHQLPVLLDWSDLGNGFEVLRASVSYGARSLPVAWATTKKGHYGRSRNVFETNLCRVIKALLPPEVRPIIVADRGFTRASFFRALTQAGIGFVVRVRKDVHLMQGRGRGPLENRSIRRGQTRDLVDARYGEDARLPIRCVITLGWGSARKVPTHPWYLVTNLGAESLSAEEVVRAYKKRMRIEQGFRDDKSLRFGFQLRSVHLTTPERYDRLFAIATLSLLLLVNIGALVEKRGWHRTFKANTDPARTHSLFHLGLAYFDSLGLRAPQVRLFLFCFEMDT
jgi:hypothetical protein